MNYNPNAGMRNPQGPGRKIKRVSDINAMGPTVPMPNATPYMQPAAGAAIFDPTMSAPAGYGGPQTAAPMGVFNNAPNPMPQQNYGYTPQQIPSTQPQAFLAAGTGPQMQFGTAPATGQFGTAPATGQFGNPGQFANTMPQLSMFQQPIVQDMAMEYGQRLADQGKQLVENQFEKWIPVAKLKYYFAVDNKYVLNKLRLLFFPFSHKDWSLKYDQENPVQPRYDVNAPDLYIPTMAYITYVVIAGLMLGMQDRFSPEQLGMQASSALAYCIFEIIVYLITIYVVNIKTNLKTLDLLAFAGYKFVAIVACLLASTLFYTFGYYTMLTYCTLSLGFFLLRTLRTKVLLETAPVNPSGPINYDPYGNPQQYDHTGGRKRKMYFLFLIVGGQAFLMFLLSKHLYLPDAASKAKNFEF